MIAGILKLLLFISIAIAAIIGFALFGLFSHVRKTVQNFARQGQNDNPQPQHRGNDMEEVTDTRSHDKAGRKIFSKDEGEYVEYTEEP